MAKGDIKGARDGKNEVRKGRRDKKMERETTKIRIWKKGKRRKGRGMKVMKERQQGGEG